jgi:hypothetical protein
MVAQLLRKLERFESGGEVVSLVERFEFLRLLACRRPDPHPFLTLTSQQKGLRHATQKTFRQNLVQTCCSSRSAL